MLLLLSGEGPGDIGSNVLSVDPVEGGVFKAGPMARIIDRLVDTKWGCSPIDCNKVKFVDEGQLSRIGKQLQAKKSLSMPGVRRPKETQYFERGARALAIAAHRLTEEIDDSVIAVLFRDSDGTHSSERGLWKNKRDSMIRGFEKEKFTNGVPMVPKPKSEAWLLCSAKLNPYQHCAKLENEPGNDRSPNSLKKQLDDAVGEHLGATEWADKVQNGDVDLTRINMPSFNDFKQRLFDVLDKNVS